MMARVGVFVPTYGMAESGSYVTRWLVGAGDRVEAGSPMAEVETSKAEAVVEAPESGVLVEIVVAEDQEAAAGSPLAWIETDP